MADVYQLTDISLVGQVALANVLYIEQLVDDGIGDPYLKILNGWKTNILSPWKMLQSNGLTHDCALIRKVFPLTEVARVFDVDEDGMKPAQMLPSNTAVTIRHYSGDGSKRLRGRYFFTGMTELDVEKGRLTESAHAAFDPLLAALIAPYAEAGDTHVINHYSKANNAYYDIVDAKVTPCVTKVRQRTPRLCPIS